MIDGAWAAAILGQCPVCRVIELVAEGATPAEAAIAAHALGHANGRLAQLSAYEPLPLCRTHETRARAAIEHAQRMAQQPQNRRDASQSRPR